MTEHVNETREIPVDAKQDPTALLSKEGVYVGVNEAMLEVHGRTRDELIGLSGDETIARNYIECGKDLQRVMDGETIERVNYIRRKDGSVVQCDAIAEPVDIDGERFGKVTTLETTEVEPASDCFGQESPTDSLPTGMPDPDSAPLPDIEGIPDERLEQIMRNVRVTCVEGEVSLNAIMLDLAVAHNELGEYRKGALTLAQCVDDRIVREQNRCRDEDVLTALTEVQDMAMAIYERFETVPAT